MELLIKIALATVTIASLIHQSDSVKCKIGKIAGSDETTCNYGSGPHCMVGKVASQAGGSEVPGGCVNDAIIKVCNKKTEVGGAVISDTCCCSSDNCNKDLATCKAEHSKSGQSVGGQSKDGQSAGGKSSGGQSESGSVVQYGSLLMMAMAPLITIFMF